MSEKKNIDKLFKEQLKNFEVAPNDAVWENIERELHKDKRKRRIIPIWWQIAGVAAVLALLFTVGNTWYNNNTESPIEQEVVDTENSNNKSTNEQNDNRNSSEDFNNTPVITNEDSEGTKVATNQDPQNKLTPSKVLNDDHTVATSEENEKKDPSETASVIRNKSQQKDTVVSAKTNLPKHLKNNIITNSSQKNAVATSTNEVKTNNKQDDFKKEASTIDKLIEDSKNSKTALATTVNTSENEKAITAIDTSATNASIKEENAIETAIAEANSTEEKTEEEAPLKRWSVAPNVAPVYFNTLGKGSSIDNQFVDNNKEGSVNMSYGVAGSYAINKKLKIRAGVNRVDLGYSTNNVITFNRPSASGANTRLKNIKLNDTMTTFISANSISFSTAPDILFTKEQGAIDQQLGFIEVPLELEYSLIDKKIGLNLIGGFSTLFLNNNEVYSVQNNGDRTLLGEATNINDMSYSANFGIGVNYNISKQLRFNLEPMFKYQINTFNDTSGNFQPYFIGVYTGLSFKF